MDSLTPPTSSTSEIRLPARMITKHPADIHQINPEYVLLLEGLLVLSHNKMDEDNVKTANGYHCRWCKGPWGYDQQGIRHEDDCILIRIRQVVTV